MYTHKTVLVTGASSGIGLAMSQQLAARGAKLILVARSTDKLQSLATDIKGQGGEAYVFTCDLSIPQAAEGLYGEIKDAGLTVDILINNAGYGRWGNFTEYERDDYAHMIQLNITSLTDLCHLFLQDMEQRGSGGIINVASTAGFVPVPYGAVYGSTKAYVLTFSEALRYEYKDKGIHIMVLCPGATKSNFMDVATQHASTPQVTSEDNNKLFSFQTSDEVAQECLRAFEKNKQYIISGRSNRILHMITSHLPRRTVLNFVGNMFRKVVGK